MRLVHSGSGELSRWRDSLSATITSEPQVWVSDGWCKRFGLPEMGTELGDTPEQVAAFRVERDMLSDIWMRPIKRPSSVSLSLRQHNSTNLSNIRPVIAARHGRH